MDEKIQAIFAAIKIFVATKLNRFSITWEEVEEIYESGKYPDINAGIDYIVGG